MNNRAFAERILKLYMEFKNNDEVITFVTQLIGQRVDSDISINLITAIQHSIGDLSERDYNEFVDRLDSLEEHLRADNTNTSAHTTLDTQAMDACLRNVEMFLEHNIKAGHLKKETSVDGVLHFIKNIRERYIPVVKDINDYVDNVLK